MTNMDLADYFEHCLDRRQPVNPDDEIPFADDLVDDWFPDQPSASWRPGVIDQTAPVSMPCSSNTGWKGRW
jgi:hypothetical protein